MSCQQAVNRAAAAGKQAGIAGISNKVGATPLPVMPRRSGTTKKAGKTKKGKPRLIKLPAFSQKEMDSLYVQLSLAQAALRRHLKSRKEGFDPGPLYRDPRPPDWATLDMRQYDFLARQLKAARQGEKQIDTAGLSKQELSDLWAFSQYEAERAQRRIDNLNIPGGPIGPPTRDYLIKKHKLETQFHSALAAGIEQFVPIIDLHEAQV
jgi:hypothetical protein